MGFFSNIVDLSVNIVKLPVDIIKDEVTLIIIYNLEDIVINEGNH